MTLNPSNERDESDSSIFRINHIYFYMILKASRKFQHYFIINNMLLYTLRHYIHILLEVKSYNFSKRDTKQCYFKYKCPESNNILRKILKLSVRVENFYLEDLKCDLRCKIG